MQAKDMAHIFTAADTALQTLQPATAVATIAAAEALRKVLEALEQLSCHTSEAALKQLIGLLRASAPELQQACWLLVSQQDTLRKEVAKPLLLCVAACSILPFSLCKCQSSTAACVITLFAHV